MYRKQIRRLWVESSLERFTSGSTNPRRALAFAKVVVIRLCSIKLQAILANIAFLWAVLRPRWLNFFPCLMVTDFEGSDYSASNLYLLTFMPNCRPLLSTRSSSSVKLFLPKLRNFNRSFLL